MGYLIWALVGWCGTPYPRRWPFPPPPSGPPWDPWVAKGIGVVGGLVGGFGFTEYIDQNVLMGVAGAYVGSTILSEVVGLFQGGQARK